MLQVTPRVMFRGIDSDWKADELKTSRRIYAEFVYAGRNMQLFHVHLFLAKTSYTRKKQFRTTLVTRICVSNK